MKPLYGIIARRYDHPHAYGLATSLRFSSRILACKYAATLAEWIAPLVLSFDYIPPMAQANKDLTPNS